MRRLFFKPIMVVMVGLLVSCATMGRVKVETTQSLEYGSSTIYSTLLVADKGSGFDYNVRFIKGISQQGNVLYNLFVRLDKEVSRPYMNQLLIKADDKLFKYTLEPTVNSTTFHNMFMSQSFGWFGMGFGTSQNNYTERALIEANRELLEALLKAATVQVQVSGAEMKNVITTLKPKKLAKLQQALAQIEAK